MLFEFSFTKVFLTLFLLFVAWLFKWFYKSSQLQKFYRNQGISTSKREKNPNPDDELYPTKLLAQQEPNTKGLVSPGPGGAFLILTDAEIIKEFLLHDNTYYRKSFKIPSTSLLTSEGELWKKHRRSVSAALQFGYHNSMMPILLETINEYIPLSQKTEMTLTAPRDFQVFICDVLSRIFFGINPNKSAILKGKSPFLEALEVSELSTPVYRNPLVWIFGEKGRNFLFYLKGLDKRWKALKEHFRGEIQIKMKEIQKMKENNQETQRKDLLYLLLDERSKFNNDPDKTLSDAEILDEYFSFLVGGKDTTGAFLSMFLYCYVTQKEWAQKLDQEISEKLLNNEITVDIVKSMDLLTAFTKEVLRIYTPTPGTLPRVAKETHKLGNFEVKKGTMCMCFTGFNHFSPKYFQDPLTFNPDRWLQKDNHEASSIAYLPFSAGPRQCVGQNMALLIGKVLMTLIIKNFNVTLDPKYRLQMTAGMRGYSPKNPMKFTLSPK